MSVAGALPSCADAKMDDAANSATAMSFKRMMDSLLR
jgi:hypothetical protein